MGLETPRPDDAPLDIGRHEIRTDGGVGNKQIRVLVQVWLLSSFAIWAARVAASFAPNIVLGLLLAAAGGYAAIAAAKAVFHEKVTGKPVAYVGVLFVGALFVCAFGLVPAFPVEFAGSAGVMFVLVIVATAFVGNICDSTSRNFDQYRTLAYAAAALVLALATLPVSTLATQRVATMAALGVSVTLWFYVTDVYAGYVLAHPEHTVDKIEADRAWWRRRREWLSMKLGMLAGGIGGIWLAAITKEIETPSSPAVADDGVFLWWSLAFYALIIVPAAAAFYWARRAVWQSVLVWTLYAGPDTPGIYKPKGRLGSVRTRQALLAFALVLCVFAIRFAMHEADVGVASHCLTILRRVNTEPSALFLVALYASSFIVPFVFLLVPAVLVIPEIREIYKRVEEAKPDEPYKREGLE